MSRIEAAYHLSRGWNRDADLDRIERERDALWLVLLITIWRYREALEHMEALCQEMDKTQQANWKQSDKLAALMEMYG